jgi:hypothetical protein
VSCADDRFTDEQLALWADWDPEPPGVDPADDELQLIGPHLWVRRAWRPVEDLQIAQRYRTAI